MGKLESFGSTEAAIAAIDQSMDNGWTGLFYPKSEYTPLKLTDMTEKELAIAKMMTEALGTPPRWVGPCTMPASGSRTA